MEDAATGAAVSGALLIYFLLMMVAPSRWP